MRLIDQLWSGFTFRKLSCATKSMFKHNTFQKIAHCQIWFAAFYTVSICIHRNLLDGLSNSQGEGGDGLKATMLQIRGCSWNLWRNIINTNGPEMSLKLNYQNNLLWSISELQLSELLVVYENSTDSSSLCSGFWWHIKEAFDFTCQ